MPARKSFGSCGDDELTPSEEVQPWSARFLTSSRSDSSNCTSKSTNSYDIKNIIPDFSNTGRICVIGGSEAETGPPFFAGLVALKCGADRVTILTTPSASIPIKCYSESLTVIPYLPEKKTKQSKNFISQVWPHIKDNDVFCFGPGLGDGEILQTALTKLIVQARISNIPVVLNAGALLLLNENRMELLSQTLPKAPVVVILNEDEFVLMWSKLHSQGVMSFRQNTSRTVPSPVSSRYINQCPMAEVFRISPETNPAFIHQTAHLGNALGRNVVIIRMGLIDIIAHGSRSFVFGGQQLRKRCSDHGHLLAGLVTMFLAWQKIKGLIENPMTACKSADFVIRLASLDAFGSSTRGVFPTDVALQIPGVMRNLGLFSHVESLASESCSTNSSVSSAIIAEGEKK